MIKNFHEVLASGQLNLQSLEQHRMDEVTRQKKESMKWLLVIGIIIIVLVIVCFIFKTWALIIIGIVVGLVVYFLKTSSMKNKLESTIKDDLVKNLVRSIDNTMTYLPKQCINQKLLKDSQLIKHWSTYGGEDYFKGTINNIPFEFSELTLKVKRDKSYSIIFQGPFFAVDFPQTFKGTSVLPDTMEKLLGGLGRAFQKMNLSRIKESLIKIENVPFEKLFAVYSKNEAESKQILQPNLCSLLMDERNKVGKRGSVYFSCYGNKFYLGLYNFKDIFAINVKQEINENNLQRHYNEFVSYMNLLLNIYSMLEENMQNPGFNTAPPPPMPPKNTTEPNIPKPPKDDNKFNTVNF